MTQKQHYKEILSKLDVAIHEARVMAEPTALVLSYFKTDLFSKDLSDKTKKIHADNIYYIAHFNSYYDIGDSFDLNIFMDGPHNEYRFSSKVSSSKYTLQGYRSAWRKLTKYIANNFDFLQVEIG